MRKASGLAWFSGGSSRPSAMSEVACAACQPNTDAVVLAASHLPFLNDTFPRKLLMHLTVFAVSVFFLKVGPLFLAGVA